MVNSHTKPKYIFCSKCGNIAWIDADHSKHNKSSGVDHVEIHGVFVAEEFISLNEENELIELADSHSPWIPSQEGRAKQDYGPRVNFLKKKVSLGEFKGFPNFAQNLFHKMQATYPERFCDFIPVEFCILEYTPERGSYIRPHYDDKWIWGDRLITVNLSSETCLRLSREFNTPPLEIVVKMPRRSLVVIYGEARYEWHHSINKYDIRSRRIAMTWREFGEEILREEEHKEFIDRVFTIASQS